MSRAGGDTSGEKKTSWNKCAVVKGHTTSPLVWGGARAKEAGEKNTARAGLWRH